MFRLKTLLALLAAMLMPAVASAAPGGEAFIGRVDGLIQAEMQKQKIPGLALAIVRGGEVIVAKGYGSANVEHDVPVTRATIFQSGSVGKMFTSAAVMLQVERGKLGLDTSIVEYLPDAPAKWRPITLRHLLTHTSGIPDYPEGFDYRRDFSEVELAKAAYQLPLEFKPGERWNYSNTGYILLGIIVHKASGKFYGDVLRDEIFKPLGMKTARNISEADIVPHRAAGYRLANGELKNQEWVSPTLNTTADGSLYFTLDDMIAWDRAVRAGAILSADSWTKSYTPVRLNSGKTEPYGFGWMIGETGGKPRHYHGGSWQGFRSHYSRFLAGDLSVILFANSAEAETEGIVTAIARLYDPKLITAVAKPAQDAAPTVN